MKSLNLLLLIILIQEVFLIPSLAQKKNDGKETDKAEKITEIASIEESEVIDPSELKKIKSKSEIIISASKIDSKKRETGASITVITEKKIKDSGKSNVGEILEDVPGLILTRTSSFGGESSIGIRGGHQKNVLVLIDGVEVNDPIGTSREFNFAYLSAGNIERIEIIRGPNSVLYGSDASGGVINIITKKARSDKPEVNISLEGGSYTTIKKTAALRGKTDNLNYSIFLSKFTSDGLSKAKKAKGATEEPERDGYKNTTASSRFGLKLTDDSLVVLALRYTDAEVDVDGGAYNDESNHKNYNKSLSTSLILSQNILSFWDHKLTLAYASKKREDDVFDSKYLGKTEKIEWQNNFKIKDIDVITIGIDHEQDTGRSNSLDNYREKKVKSIGYYIQNHIKLFDRFFLIAGGRLDDHQTYGRYYNYSISSSFILPIIETRLKGNYATGYKSPAVYQLFDSEYVTGNPDLKPEESKSYDFGFEHIFFDIITIEALYFHGNYKNMIDYESGFPKGIYNNKTKVKTSGYELAVNVTPFKGFTFTGDYTYTKTKDFETGKSLLRRPEQKATGKISWDFLNSANVNLSGIYVGKKDDTYFDAGTKYAEINPYFRIDIAASYKIKYYRIYGRIENLTNNKYVELYGYSTPERSYYTGVEIEL
jgi:vitamin B12 transporter